MLDMRTKMVTTLLLSTNNQENGTTKLKSVQDGKRNSLATATSDVVVEKIPCALDIAKLILQNNPEIKIIIATDDDSIASEVHAAGFVLLRKPFAMYDLLNCILDVTKINLSRLII